MLKTLGSEAAGGDTIVVSAQSYADCVPALTPYSRHAFSARIHHETHPRYRLRATRRTHAMSISFVVQSGRAVSETRRVFSVA
jgi:hypothetical protein